MNIDCVLTISETFDARVRWNSVAVLLDKSSTGSQIEKLVSDGDYALSTAGYQVERTTESILVHPEPGASFGEIGLTNLNGKSCFLCSAWQASDVPRFENSGYCRRYDIETQAYEWCEVWDQRPKNTELVSSPS